MDKREFRQIVNSNDKLWSLATTENIKTGAVRKSIDVPLVGTVTLSFEGMDNAEGRRAAFEIWGDHVRGLFEDATDDETIVAKAQLRDAKASEGNGGVIKGPISGADVEEGDKVSYETPVSASKAIAKGAESVADAITDREGLVRRYEEDIERYRKEIEALRAYLEVMNAPSNKKAPVPSEEPALEKSSGETS